MQRKLWNLLSSSHTTCSQTNCWFVFVGGFETSPILNKNKDYIAKLNGWLGHTKWKRCHSTRDDGPSSRTFHGNCDKRGPTVTIVRVGEYIFGGYASQAFTSKLIQLNRISEKPP